MATYGALRTTTCVFGFAVFRVFPFFTSITLHSLDLFWYPPDGLYVLKTMVLSEVRNPVWLANNLVVKLRHRLRLRLRCLILGFILVSSGRPLSAENDGVVRSAKSGLVGEKFRVVLVAH